MFWFYFKIRKPSLPNNLLVILCCTVMSHLVLFPTLSSYPFDDGRYNQRDWIEKEALYAPPPPLLPSIPSPTPH